MKEEADGGANRVFVYLYFRAAKTETSKAGVLYHDGDGLVNVGHFVDLFHWLVGPACVTRNRCTRLAAVSYDHRLAMATCNCCVPFSQQTLG